MPERVVDDLEAVEIEKKHRRGVTRDSNRFQRVRDTLGEEQAVGEAGEPVVIRLMLEGFLQLGHLRQRPFETAVLEQHARMTGERLEDPEIVVRERRHVSGAVADQDQAECLRLRAQNADDAVLEPARGEQRVQRVRRPPPSEDDRRARGREDPERVVVGLREWHRAHQGLSLRAARRPQRAVLRARRGQDDLGVLGAQELPRREEQLADRKAELRRLLRPAHRFVEEAHPLGLLPLLHVGAERQPAEHGREDEEQNRRPVGVQQLHRRECQAAGCRCPGDCDQQRPWVLAQRPLALGEEDHDRHERHADEAHHADRREGSRPGAYAVQRVCADYRPEQEHRDCRAEQQLADVEQELHRPLAPADGKGDRGAERLPDQKAARGAVEEPDDDDDLVERQRVCLAPKVDVHDVGLGEECHHGDRPPRQHGRRKGSRRVVERHYGTPGRAGDDPDACDQEPDTGGACQRPPTEDGTETCASCRLGVHPCSDRIVRIRT